MRGNTRVHESYKIPGNFRPQPRPLLHNVVCLGLMDEMKISSRLSHRICCTLHYGARRLCYNTINTQFFPRFF